MPRKTHPRTDPPILQARAGLKTLQTAVRRSCLDDTLEAHLAKLLSKSDQSLRKQDIESANDQIDLFILGVQRNRWPSPCVDPHG